MSNKLPTIPRIHFEPRWHPYIAINTYLGSKATDKAKNLRASQMRDSKVLDLKRDETTVSDEYEGSKVWWKIMTDANGKKSYRLTFHNRARSVVTVMPRSITRRLEKLGREVAFFMDPWDLGPGPLTRGSNPRKNTGERMKPVPELLRSSLSSSAHPRAPPLFYELLSSSRNALDHLRAPRLIPELLRSSTSSSARHVTHWIIYGLLSSSQSSSALPRAPLLVLERLRIAYGSLTSSSARPRAPQLFYELLRSLVYKVQLSRQSKHKETQLSGQPELLSSPPSSLARPQASSSYSFIKHLLPQSTHPVSAYTRKRPSFEVSTDLPKKATPSTGRSSLKKRNALWGWTSLKKRNALWGWTSLKKRNALYGPIKLKETQRPLGLDKLEETQRPLGLDKLEETQRPSGRPSSKKPSGVGKSRSNALRADQARRHPLGLENREATPFEPTKLEETLWGWKIAKQRPSGRPSSKKPSGVGKSRSNALRADQARRHPLGLENREATPFGPIKLEDTLWGWKIAKQRPSRRPSSKTPSGVGKSRSNALRADEARRHPLGWINAKQRPTGRLSLKKSNAL
ncbi:AAA-type ATPase N-terminal domain [Arabidopsis suecica]|uniref:AAA-type ATPase N-terminal domain n=1 Tax=Arabidopsis suecica TaxID=45249 RepID=A0A8T1YQS4_ARASU|nr:AAA-type ATPase N-terminal domain [Arabidopsis suecica]